MGTLFLRLLMVTGPPFVRGHPSHAKVSPPAVQRKYLHFSVILRPWVMVRPRESNPRPPALQSNALPTELILLRLKKKCPAVTPSSMSPVPIYTPRWRDTKWSKVPSLRKQRDGRGLNPGPPDPEFEALTRADNLVLTARQHKPPQLNLWICKNLLWCKQVLASKSDQMAGNVVLKAS